MADLNIDSYGLVVHADGDGGDCCADTYRYLYAKHLCGNQDQQFWEIDDAAERLLFPLVGIGVRHPTQWNDPCDWSRDQQTPAVIYLHATNPQKMLQIMSRHSQRNWRYQNLDWASSEHMGYYSPMNRTTTGDSLMLLNSFIRLFSSYLWPDGSVGPDQNHIMALLQAQVNAPSRLSRLACWVYSFRRKGIQWAVNHYYRKDNPAIARAFDWPIRKWILNEKD